MEFAKNSWKYLLGLAMLLALFYFGYQQFQDLSNISSSKQGASLLPAQSFSFRRL